MVHDGGDRDGDRRGENRQLFQGLSGVFLLDRVPSIGKAADQFPSACFGYRLQRTKS